MKIRNFRDLQVWQLGKKMVLEVYKVTRTFPQDEVYGLVSQMRRSAISIPSNIAEGFNRYHNKDYRKYLFISLGSCAELETQVEIACDIEFMTAGDRNKLLENLDHETRMLRNLIKKLR